MTEWESFKNEVKSRGPQRGPQCSVAVLLRTLPPEAREMVRAAIEDRTLLASSVSRALEARVGDDAPSAWVLNNHRRGACRCGRNK